MGFTARICESSKESKSNKKKKKKKEFWQLGGEGVGVWLG